MLCSEQSVGFENFFFDSEIIIDVMLALIDQSVTVVVPTSEAETVRQIMLDVFKSHTGIEGAFNTE